MLTNEGRLFETIHLEGGRDEWLDLRRDGVGGSDVAAIMGMSKWSSPIEVWLDKTRRSTPPDISDKEPIRMGNELEPTVLEMYRRRHPESRARRVNAVLRSKDRPWAQASLDGITHDAKMGWGVLELKTSSSMADWADGIPLYYLTQVTHYLSVTGYPFADVAALVGDRGLHYYEARVYRDEEDVAAVTKAVDEFWHGFVEADVMPSVVVGTPGESKAIWETYKRFDADMTPDESDQADALASEYLRASEAERSAKAERTRASNALKLMVSEHKGIVAEYHVITWVRSEKRDSGIRVKEKE